jgi:hypothetical protein
MAQLPERSLMGQRNIRGPKFRTKTAKRVVERAKALLNLA